MHKTPSPIEAELNNLAKELEQAAYRVAKNSGELQEDPAKLLLTILQTLNLSRQLMSFYKENCK